MIRIGTPPMLHGNDDSENINSLRQYLYREMDSLQTQLNMVQDENDVAIAAAAMSGGSTASSDAGIKEAPKDGKLYGRQDGTWEEVDEAEGLTKVGQGNSVTFSLNGASGILVHATNSSKVYSTLIPVAWIGTVRSGWAIPMASTYLGITVTRDGDTCTVSHGTYTLDVYTIGAVGGSGGGSSGEGHSHDNKDVLDGISESDVSNWDAAYSHVGDGTVHVTATDRESWNGAVTHEGNNKKHILTLTEDMVTVARTATKGVAPYSTSYYYTDITVNDMTDDDLTEGMLILPVVASAMVVASSYRNVRIRFGSTGSWHPVMGTTSILAGSTYFTATQYRLYQYRTNTRSEGAFHLLTDSNTTYSVLTDSEAAAGTATTGRTISAVMWKKKQDAISDLDDIRSGASAGATALQSYTETDPTVPSWAKQPSKPSYSASEVGASPSNHTHNYSDLDGLPTIPEAYDDSALAGRVSTIEGKESAWDAKFDLPSGGTTGQVLKKTATGAGWANESGGGGSFSGITNKGSASVKTGTNLTFSISSGDTAILLLASFGSRLYSEMIPIDMLSATAKTFAIAVYNNYVEVKIALSGSTVTVSRSSTTAYTIYAYTL